MTAIRPALQPDLARYREDYPILASSTYMNSNSMGAMPRQAAQALATYAADWAREGVEVWPHWFEILEATADSAARFIGAPAGHRFAPRPSSLAAEGVGRRQFGSGVVAPEAAGAPKRRDAAGC